MPHTVLSQKKFKASPVPRVLLVNDQGDESAIALSQITFGKTTEVVETESAVAAMELLANQQFDAMLVCNQRDIASALQNYLHNEAVLDCIPLGVALLDTQQHILKANQRLTKWLSNRDLVGLHFSESLGEFSFFGKQLDPFQAAISTGTATRATIQLDDRYFSLYVTPVLDEAGVCCQLVATLRESTSQVIQKQKFEALHQAGSELTDLRPEEIYQMDFQERIELLKDNIHHYTEDLLNFDVVEIRVLNTETLELKPLLSAGMDSGISQRALYAKKEGNGVTGFVAATGKSYLCEDTAEDELYLDGLVGAKSALTVPLKYHDEIVGTFNVESPEVNRFSNNDLEFLESFARYIAIALNTLELLNAQRTNATLQSVEAIRNAVSTPVDEILNHTVQVIENFRGQDEELVHRLATIAQLARDIKGSICEVGDGLAPAHAVPGCVKEDLNPKLRNKHVLVIDNDPIVRSSAHHLLERQGCVVETAHTGAEAMMMVGASYRKQPYDAIIADIRLPDIKGYEILVMLKDFYAQPPLVLMTGYGYDPGHTIPKAREAGLQAGAVLYKPFRLEQVLQILESTFLRQEESTVESN